MGMQCTFSYTDLTDLVQFEIVSLHETNSDTWSVEVWYKPQLDWEQRELIVSFNLSVPENKQADKHFCWFDCGGFTEEQQYMIGFLIRHRISFACA